ncbi:hypothetical protein MNBD_NITROSPIRAE01-1140 [hydrothermal vent metagenome]|uniref:Methyl-accepting transducer domain-containing protein n=1 Tax=hydrothermal vent metagenome TaxID=652676 RepID=A0A3B1D967_9ZZZZ
MSSYSKYTMQGKLMLIIVLTLAIGLGCVSFLSIRNDINNIKNTEISNMDLLSNVIVEGIKNAMVTGNAPIVIKWLDSIKKSNGLLELKDYRRDGKAAFTNNDTRKEVNEWLGIKRFSMRLSPKEPSPFDPERMDAFKQVVDSAKAVSYDDEIDGEAVFTRLVPIIKDERCFLCHGYDAHPVRSILQISVSKTAMISAINNDIMWAIISSLAMIIVIAFIMGLLINREVIRPITQAVSRISKAARSQDQITSRQASSVHEITVTIEELSASSKQVNAKADSLAEQSKEALFVTHEGQKAIDESISEMNEIKKKVEDIAEDVLTLSENTHQIGAIIHVVGDIANKTDMLAVNAAIEAAKAEEHGKGFAVVASEVRSLADQSKKAAEKIESLVEEIQNSVNSTVMTTEEGGKKVDLGVNHILQAGSTINAAIETITATADAANEIAIASRQESLANDQVAEAMGQINRGMQASSAATKESLSSISELQNRIDDKIREIKESSD